MKKTIIALAVAGYIAQEKAEKELEEGYGVETTNAWRKFLNDVVALPRQSYTYLWNNFVPDVENLPTICQEYLKSKVPDNESESEKEPADPNSETDPKENGDDSENGNDGTSENGENGDDTTNTDPDSETETGENGNSEVADNGDGDGNKEETPDPITRTEMVGALVASGKTKKELKGLSDEEIAEMYASLTA